MHDPVDLQIVLEEGATLPTYQTVGSAGMDLCTNEDFEIQPGQRRFVGTGLRIALPFGYEAQVRPRSGLAIKHGISMVNSPGTIDSDYRGEIKLIMINFGENVVYFKRGDRVAQMVICPTVQARLLTVETLEETVRGSGGFGSTGL